VTTLAFLVAKLPPRLGDGDRFWCLTASLPLSDVGQSHAGEKIDQSPYQGLSKSSVALSSAMGMSLVPVKRQKHSGFRGAGFAGYPR
jgi:hypothetical protein